MGSVKILVTLMLLASVAKAQENCSLVFKNEKPVNFSVEKALDVNFVKEFVLNENGRYDVKMVDNRGPILNQDSLGFCHLYALDAELVREYKQRNGGKDPNIAIHYNAFHHWYNRAVETALKPDSSLAVPEGGWYPTTFRMIKEVGVMTNEQWAKIGGRTDVETRYKVGIESGQLKLLMLESKLQLGTLEEFLKNDFKDVKSRKDYFQEIYKKGDNGPLLHLKKLVLQKAKELNEGTTALTKEDLQLLNDLTHGFVSLGKLSKDQIHEIKFRLRQDIIRDVQRQFAAMFFDRKEIPHEVLNTAAAVQLSKDLFPEMHQSTLSISVSEEREAGPVRFLGRTKPNELNFDAPIEVLSLIIADQVENKNNGVWIGYDHNGNFVDNASGAMTFRGFQWNPFSPYINRKLRNGLGIYDGGHAVQVVGTIRAKPTEKEKAAGIPGKLLGFKIQNSWGDKVGQSGIFTMDMDYFRAFFWGITIRDENNQFSQSNLPQRVEKGSEPTFPKELFLKKGKQK